ncbi:CsgG/HfaB family protein [Campylobacter sp. 19-13652]|uniref:CsgG/HfaB family protein n=1 Tax=Campylobacter sp. 19-13652 TaxID=2840180 RepID=UPI001C795942|nr:CsgG/HfaB family protein [Campylobacter sp. 19-13652]BCX78926.1 hypothetical protein LBC_03880 [Campylobacter sp. 19-13652]
MKKYLGIAATSVLLAGCAGVVIEPSVKSTPSSKAQNIAPEYHGLKRKVAIARFGTESKYGNSSLFGVSYDVSKQATDILSAKLSESGKFILLERSDLSLIQNEQSYSGINPATIGADYLLVGSITEFGRKEKSDVAIFSRTRYQTAYAGVSVRIVDTATGQVIYGTQGQGEATSEAGSTFGVGTHQGYDATLNDKAISAAFDNVINKIMQNLLDKPWKSYVLSVEGDSIVMGGGARQNVKIGDEFGVYKKGKMVKNPQTGAMIELPGTKIASVRVISQFGSNYTDEGSVASVISGSIKGIKNDEIYIAK